MSNTVDSKPAAVSSDSDVIWAGRPWVVPRFVGFTITALLAAGLLTWLEFRFGLALVRISSPLLPLIVMTYLVVVFIWLIASLNLALLRVSHKYVLRRSSLEISRGILSRKVYTLSASGFSDLEVIQGIGGRVLDMGDIQIETDSARDLRLIMLHDPMKVASIVRQVMTTPTVRVASDIPPAAVK